MSARIEVAGQKPYSVVIGHNLMSCVPGLLPDAAQVAVVFADPLRVTAERVAATLRAAGRTVLPIEVPDAEAGKTIEVAARCWDALGAARFTRTDAVVGVGGGAVTDLAGCVAASWLRGVRVVPVPTSLLGMVDAAVGGKTGVNTAAGKNLVGAFHPPVGVLCDLVSLETLPDADLRSGLAEVVKGGFIADPVILDLIEGDPQGAADPTGPLLGELVTSGDPGQGRRGRELTCASPVCGRSSTTATLWPTPSSGSRDTWRHGDAVSVGLVYAAALGRRTGRLEAAPWPNGTRDPAAARAAGDLPGRGLGRAARRDAGGQEGARGEHCGSWSSTAWRSRPSWRTRTRRLLRAAYQEVVRGRREGVRVERAEPGTARVRQPDVYGVTTYERLVGGLRAGRHGPGAGSGGAADRRRARDARLAA